MAKTKVANWSWKPRWRSAAKDGLAGADVGGACGVSGAPEISFTRHFQTADRTPWRIGLDQRKILVEQQAINATRDLIYSKIMTSEPIDLHVVTDAEPPPCCDRRVAGETRQRDCANP